VPLPQYQKNSETEVFEHNLMEIFRDIIPTIVDAHCYLLPVKFDMAASAILIFFGKKATYMYT